MHNACVLGKSHWWLFWLPCWWRWIYGAPARCLQFTFQWDDQKAKQQQQNFNFCVCVCVYHSLFIFSETPKHFIVCHLLLTLNKFGFVKYSNVGRASWNVCSTFWVDLFWIFVVFFFWWLVKRSPPLPGPPMARHTSHNKTKRSRVRNFKSIWWFPTQIRSRRDWLVD